MLLRRSALMALASIALAGLAYTATTGAARPRGLALALLPDAPVGSAQHAARAVTSGDLGVQPGTTVATHVLGRTRDGLAISTVSAAAQDGHGPGSRFCLLGLAGPRTPAFKACTDAKSLAMHAIWVGRKTSDGGFEVTGLVHNGYTKADFGGQSAAWRGNAFDLVTHSNRGTLTLSGPGQRPAVIRVDR
jgi:hypothetical protein